MEVPAPLFMGLSHVPAGWLAAVRPSSGQQLPISLDRSHSSGPLGAIESAFQGHARQAGSLFMHLQPWTIICQQQGWDHLALQATNVSLSLTLVYVLSL